MSRRTFRYRLAGIAALLFLGTITARFEPAMLNAALGATAAACLVAIVHDDSWRWLMSGGWRRRHARRKRS